MRFELHRDGVLDTTELSSQQRAVYRSCFIHVSTVITQRQFSSYSVCVRSVLSFTRALSLKLAMTQRTRASKSKPLGSRRKGRNEDSRFKCNLGSSLGKW